MYTYKTVIFALDDTLLKTDTRLVATNHELNEDKLYDAIKAMLASLKNEGYTLVLCSDYSEEYTNEILRYLNISQYFHTIKYKKYGLKKFQLIKQALDENACSSAIVVGSKIDDFEAAEETRCLSIGVSYGHHNNGYGRNTYENFDFVADNPLDVHTAIRKINGIYKEAALQILKRKQRNKPLIVGINGVDTCGKSTFTKELERYLFKIGFKSQIVAMDDFHNPSKIRNKEQDPIASYINNAFDIRKIQNELLKPVIADGLLNKELLLLDLEKDEFVNRKSFAMDEDTIILLEGVLLYREPLNQYFHFRIFIDISFEEVLKRAVKRDASLFGNAVIEKYKNKYIPIQKLYIERYSPKDMSDIIIDNNDYFNPKIIKQPYINKLEATPIRLEAIGEKHLCDICKMTEESEAREMLGIVTVPVLEDFTLKNNISKAILNKENEFIGIVELFNISWKNRRAELSITIKDKMRGKGYGYMAINKILETAFVEHGMHRVFLRVLDTNIKAINLYKKVGFVQEGICKGESLRKGKFINQMQMSILSSEWIERFFIT